MAGKGTIIKIQNNRGVIMTDQCEFIEIGLKSPARAGDSIYYSDADLRHASTYRKMTAVAASLVLCCLLAVFLLYQPFLARTYALVSFDINPSFELGIDRDNRVTTVRGLNRDGEQLLDQIQITDSSLNQAVSQIVRQSILDGYLDSDKVHYIAVSIYFPDDVNDQGFLDNLNVLLMEELNDNNIPGTVYYYKIDKQTYTDAWQNKVSPSRWLLRQAAQQSGFNYDLSGDLPWSDGQFTAIATANACQKINLQAGLGGADHSSEEIPGVQQGQTPSQDKKGSDMNHSGQQSQNGRSVPEISDTSEQRISSGTTFMRSDSTMNSSQLQQQSQDANNNDILEPDSLFSGNSNSSAGPVTSEYSDGSNGSNASAGSSNTSDSRDSSGAGAPGGSGGSGGSGSSGGSGGSAGSSSSADSESSGGSGGAR